MSTTEQQKWADEIQSLLAINLLTHHLTPNAKEWLSGLVRGELRGAVADVPWENRGKSLLAILKHIAGPEITDRLMSDPDFQSWVNLSAPSPQQPHVAAGRTADCTYPSCKTSIGCTGTCSKLSPQQPPEPPATHDSRATTRRRRPPMNEQERKEFEAAIENQYSRDSSVVGDKRIYTSPLTRAALFGWQAARSRQAAPQAAPEPGEVAFLIERGQAQKHAPTVWATPDRDWTQDANKAKRFKTRDEAYMFAEGDEKHWLWSKPGDEAKYGKSYAITEHSWLDAAPQPGVHSAGPSYKLRLAIEGLLHYLKSWGRLPEGGAAVLKNADEAWADFATPAPEPPAAPAGFVMVPRDPTPLMLACGGSAANQSVADVWRSMLDAAELDDAAKDRARGEGDVT